MHLANSQNSHAFSKTQSLIKKSLHMQLCNFWQWQAQKKKEKRTTNSLKTYGTKQLKKIQFSCEFFLLFDYLESLIHNLNAIPGPATAEIELQLRGYQGETKPLFQHRVAFLSRHSCPWKLRLRYCFNFFTDERNVKFN